jgi:hypothetical protein
MKKLLFLVLSSIFLSCERDEIICDTSFKTMNLHVRDTLEFVKVHDTQNGFVLYYDSLVYQSFKVVDDSYFNIIGPNKQTDLNIEFRYINDTVHKRVVPICIFTDECHINFFYPHDTLTL